MRPGTSLEPLWRAMTVTERVGTTDELDEGKVAKLVEPRAGTGRPAIGGHPFAPIGNDDIKCASPYAKFSYSRAIIVRACRCEAGYEITMELTVQPNPPPFRSNHLYSGDRSAL